LGAVDINFSVNLLLINWFGVRVPGPVPSEIGGVKRKIYAITIIN